MLAQKSVDRHHGRADLRQSEKQHDPFRKVDGPDRYPLAFLDAKLGQTARTILRQVLQLTKSPAKPKFGIDQGIFVRILSCLPGENIAQQTG